MKALYRTILIALLASVPSLAETGAVVRVSMARAVEMALDSSGALRAERAGERVAEGIRMSADGLARPTLGARLAHRRAEGGAGGGESSARLSAGLPLYLGGRVNAERRRADRQGELARTRVATTRRAVARDARLAYCRVLLAERLETVSATQAEIAGQFLESTRERLKRQLVGEREVLRAEVELANQQADLLRARDVTRVQRVELMRILGLPADAQCELVDRLDALDAELPVSPGSTADLAAARPEVVQARTQARSRGPAVEALKAQRRPELRLEGAFESETDWFGYEQDDWQVGVTLSLPFLDAWPLLGNVQQEEARQYQDVQRALDVERDIRAAVDQAQVQLAGAAARAEHLAGTVQKASAYLVGEHERLALGSATYLDVLNARRTLAQSERDYSRALFDKAAARIELTVE